MSLVARIVQDELGWYQSDRCLVIEQLNRSAPKKRISTKYAGPIHPHRIGRPERHAPSLIPHVTCMRTSTLPPMLYRYLSPSRNPRSLPLQIENPRQWHTPLPPLSSLQSDRPISSSSVAHLIAVAWKRARGDLLLVGGGRKGGG